MITEGWIKLHRSLIEWEWYSDIPTKVLFLHILIMANYEDKKWHGIEIKRGSFITSVNKLSVETGLSKQTIRTSLKKLEISKEINIQTTNKYTLLIVCKYDCYQSETKQDQQTNQQTNQQAINTPPNTQLNTQLTTTKEIKKKEERINNSPLRKNFGKLAVLA